MTRSVSLIAAAVALSGCALKGDVRRVEDQVQQLRTATARADSARADDLQRVIDALAEVQDSLASQRRFLVQMRGDFRSDLTDVERQLVQVQELTGQSQQRLTELRAQIQERQHAQAVQPAPSDTGTAVATDTTAPPPEELFELSLQQLRRGSPQTARMGFQRFLTDYPNNPRAVDAQYFLGETWRGTNADSAAAAYQQVVKQFPDSPRAPSALYKLGLIAEQKGDSAAARVYYQRVLAGYPQSEEADLARGKLQSNR